jgi:hypothetical protein
MKMNFKVERSLADQVFTTKVIFDSFGGTGVTPEDEQALITDFGAPTIDIGSEQYVGKYKFDTATKTIIEDATAGDEVSFILNSLKVEVKTGFEVTYSVNAKRIPTTELTGKTSLTKAALIAEAKCLLFEKNIKAKLTAAINDLKSNISQFDKNAAQTFTI